MTVQNKQQEQQQEQELLKLRDQIDDIDQQIHLLINQRASCAQRVAEVKEKYQGTEDAVFYRPEREAQVLRKVMQRNQGPLEDKAVAKLFREVMSACLAHEKPLQIAYLGPAGAFAQLASHKHFGSSALTSAMNSLDQVFKRVESGVVNYGIVPIENSTQGVATQTLDLFKRYPLNICGEVELDIQLHLFSDKNIALPEITKVYALADTMTQCSSWLDKHCPSVTRIAVSSAQQAQQLVTADETGALIAGDGAIDAQWSVVAQNVGSDNEHKARFLIIGRQQIPPSGFDKTSILIATQDKPGALYELLTPFRESNISLTRIDTHSGESALGSDCSVFYIDFEGHKSEPQIQQVLLRLDSYSVEIKMLGSYPRAVL
ncbi:MAG: chorismate mutase [Pseudomonadales bacterium]|nr:chorismate mutase [Pseudomonadales bacterium]NRA17301.1 chorismate mutase [Oceanospirillaceae bacterium]